MLQADHHLNSVVSQHIRGRPVDNQPLLESPIWISSSKRCIHREAVMPELPFACCKTGLEPLGMQVQLDVVAAFPPPGHTPAGAAGPHGIVETTGIPPF
jgi:hypothetical protein